MFTRQKFVMFSLVVFLATSHNAIAKKSEKNIIKRPSLLLFSKPAGIKTYRLHAMPLGNGQIGAMVSGGTDLDIILLNHDRLRPNEYQEQQHSVSDRLPKLRELGLAGKWKEANHFFEEMKKDAGGKRRLNCYNPAGDLILKFALKGKPSSYSRTLDLISGVGRVQFDVGKVRYKRTYFVSTVDNAFVMHIGANKPGSVNLTVGLGRRLYKSCKLNGRATAKGMVLTGEYPCGLKFEINVKLRTEGGSIKPVKSTYKGKGKSKGKFATNLITCKVSGANALTILTSIKLTGNPLPIRPHAIKQRKHRSINFSKMLARHIADHRRYMNRAALRLGSISSGLIDSETVPKLIEQARQDKPSLRLFELVFDMGRYVLLACSRPGSEPTNLQGIWAASFRPTWHNRYQLDINIQMNYWLANLVGLHESNLPMFDFVDGMVPAAEKFARDLYDCRGLMLPVGVDGLNVRYSSNLEFVGITGWLSQHYWEHYQFTRDRQFLAQRAYPYIKRVTTFYEDFLFKNDDGKYVFIPSSSPEHKPRRRGRVSMNSTIDIAVAKEVLTNAIAAATILDLDKDLRARWQQMIKDLPDWSIGKDGALREWVDQSVVQYEGHRHLSHLYPMFPGEAITCEKTPKLVDAAVKAMQKREAAFSKDACGWTYVWLAALYARAGRGDDAYRNLAIAVKGFISPETMLSTISDISGQGLGRTKNGRLLQVEAGLGITAAISEMLMQSHAGLIRILPALPKAWPIGAVSGLCARGGFTVDIEWAAQSIKQVSITSTAESTICRVKFCRPKTRDIHVSTNGQKVSFKSLKNGIFEFSVKKGQTYLLFSDTKNKDK